MKFVLPHGGYGLGNDLIPWAKGYILAQVLGAKLLHPAWGNNPRTYYKYFDTFRYDYQLYRLLLRTLPKYRFTEEHYRAIGIKDFAAASKVFARESGLVGKKHYILEITGFWGAFGGLETAKDFVLTSLLNTMHTQQNLFSIRQRIQRDRLTVGIHVRLGDFTQAEQIEYSGIVNISIPLAWYCHVCDLLEANLGPHNVQFVICSDGESNQLNGLVDRENAVFASALPDSDISDLVTLVNADMLICSISTYSTWAALLSQKPYVWYRPNLVVEGDGLANRFIRSLGTALPIQRLDKLATGRGVALSMGDSLPTHLIDHLHALLQNKNDLYDIVHGGLVS